MSPKAEESTNRNYSHSFVDRKGGAILIKKLDDSMHQALIEKYLAYQPRDSFEGLPPIEDEACVKWVWKMIRDGTNLVALASEGDIVGHAAIFFIDRQRCEMLTVVWPQFQSRGIGTELVRSSIHLAHDMGFEKVWLSVDAADLRARHVYKECGFECLSSGDRGDVEMALDLKGQHEEEQ